MTDQKNPYYEKLGVYATDDLRGTVESIGSAYDDLDQWLNHYGANVDPAHVAAMRTALAAIDKAWPALEAAREAIFTDNYHYDRKRTH